MEIYETHPQPCPDLSSRETKRGSSRGEVYSLPAVCIPVLREHGGGEEETVIRSKWHATENHGPLEARPVAAGFGMLSQFTRPALLCRRSYATAAEVVKPSCYGQPLFRSHPHLGQSGVLFKNFSIFQLSRSRSATQ